MSLNQISDLLDLSEGEQLIGVSAAMRQLLEQVQRAALERVNILVCGEPGSGRETIARAIHAQSQLNGGAFVKVDCAKNRAHDLEALLFATSGDGNQAGAERCALE